MKTIQKLVAQILSTLLVLNLAGCKTHLETRPLAAGYEEITHPNRAPDSTEQPRVSLNYHTADGQTLLIWPSLFTSDEIIRGDVAIFVGDKAYVSSDSFDPRGTKPRVFAVRAPDPPLDITDEVLWYWSKAAGKDFRKAVELYNFASLVNQGDKLEVQLEFYVNESGWPDSTKFQLDWNQISEIMRTVKAKGTMHKDLRWETPYIQN